MLAKSWCLWRDLLPGTCGTPRWGWFWAPRPPPSPRCLPHVPKGRNSCCQVGSCSPTHLKPPWSCRAAGSQPDRLSPLSAARLRAALLQAAMLVSSSDRGEAGVLSPSGVTHHSWLWPWQKKRVGAGPLQSPSRHFGGPDLFYIFSWSMKTGKIWWWE